APAGPYTDSYLNNMLRRTLLQYSTIPALARFNLQKAAAATQNPAGIRAWLETSLQRVFPNTAASARNELQLTSARNQRVSFQVCVRNETTKRAKIECNVSGAPDLQVQVRRVGYVPLPHHTTDVPQSDLDGFGCVPGLVPDPLFPEQKTSV